MTELLYNRPETVISVTGAHSGVGKTSLCAIILRRIPGFGAVKFTKSELYTSIIDDPAQINEGQKDTSVMHAAGAEKVVWIKSRPGDLKSALNIAFHKLAGLDKVIVEGNSPSVLIAPDLNLFVLGSDGEIKEAALPVLKRADIVVYNAPEGRGPAEGIVARDCPVFTVDLLNETGEIDKLMEFIKKYISCA